MNRISAFSSTALACMACTGDTRAPEYDGTAGFLDGGGFIDAGILRADPRDAAASKDSAWATEASSRSSDTGVRDDGGDATTSVPHAEVFVYVGGWATPYPFQTYRLELARGTLTLLGTTTEFGSNPSYLSASADGRFLYIADEDYSGNAGVTVGSVDSGNELPSEIQKQPLPGNSSVVFTSIDPRGKYLLAADYNGGKAVVYGINENGRLSAEVDREMFDPGAHTHCIRVHPSGKWAYVTNKDSNMIAQYSFGADGKLAPLSPPGVKGHQGPRTIAFHPSMNFVYVSDEYTSEVVAYRVNTDGTLAEVDSESTLPNGFSGMNTGAHVMVHPGGTWIYASNRGDDSIARFAIAPDGTMSFVDRAPTLGKNPRHFDIDPAGKVLVVANQGTSGMSDGSVVSFMIDGSGSLVPTTTAISSLQEPTVAAIVSRAGF
ncbi:MAG: 6-phosphogluconolactonase [Myxococcaceae bacterium]|nr:6-phosphogluconolactonase [Myxococcaceae bacterium]